MQDTKPKQGKKRLLAQAVRQARKKLEDRRKSLGKRHLESLLKTIRYHLTTEELQQALPLVDWENGPSVESLSSADVKVLEGLIEEKSQKDVYSFYVVGHSIHKIVKMLEDLGFTDDILKSGSGTNTAIVNLVTRTYYPCRAGVSMGGATLAHGVTMSEVRRLIELYDEGGPENIKPYIEELWEKYKGLERSNDMGCSYWELE